MRSISLMAVAAAIVCVGLIGCTQQSRDDYGQAASKTGEAVKSDAKVAGEVMKDAAVEGKQAADNSMMTGQIRSAISAAHDLKIKDLNVDTTGKSIVLKGIVADERAKKQAESIAVGQAGTTYKVDNQLQIGPVD